MNDVQPPEGPFTCERCGTTVDALPLTWTHAVENGRSVYFCEECARTNLRAIEGRLDSSWW
ncbi:MULTISPECIES: hypothetical protein [unclassified Streptomyces]|uniref:hypothetical protein n=1 Tax=unclassified Streptomyces TaxID=2593676 RepID=UPI001660FDCA|nr:MULTISPECIES: hypothetical protein [unclassified Streptomyces]MBD0706951.1 hypothetical protein [Streptomyces sp. CBMA291]MBD0716598.1 hypothetical protein [Streptomyces sp. CBMA370]